MKSRSLHVLVASAVVSAGLMFPPSSRSHCDTVDGPVVLAAKAALEKKDVSPVLKWVKEDAQAGIKTALAKTLAMRTKGPAARELADQFVVDYVEYVHYVEGLSGAAQGRSAHHMEGHATAPAKDAHQGSAPQHRH